MHREFRTIAEVEALDGYHQENLVVADQYAGIEGPYRFDVEVKCRLRKPNGKPCAEPHKNGWVLRLTDNSKAMVGGDCALRHFGLRSDELARDMTLASSAIQREKDIATLQRLLAERDQKLAEIQASLAAVLELKRRIADLQGKLGKLAWRALEDMGRTGNAVVRVKGVRPALYDEHDERIRDRAEVVIPIGSIKAATIAKPSSIVQVAGTLRDLATAYRRADRVAVEAERGREMKHLNAALSRHARVIQDASEFVALGQTFEQNSFAILAFVIKDKSERYKLVRVALGLSGGSASNDSAKRWVSELESALKQRHSVDRIEPC